MNRIFLRAEESSAREETHHFGGLVHGVYNTGNPKSVTNPHVGYLEDACNSKKTVSFKINEGLFLTKLATGNPNLDPK